MSYRLRCRLLPLLLFCGLWQQGNAGAYSPAPEIEPINIALSGPVAIRDAELSGLTWCGEQLVLLPQYPHVFNRAERSLFGLSKTEILAYLDALAAGGEPEPLSPQKIAVQGMAQLESLPGYDGLEAMVCRADSAYLAVELDRPGGSEATVLVAARWRQDHWQIERLSEPLASPSGVGNMANEALLWLGDQLLSIHELNRPRGDAGQAQATLLNIDDFQVRTPVAMPDVPYRITDASEPDSEGRFWVINYLYSGDRVMHVAQDPIWQRWGRSASQGVEENVERLLELQWQNGQVSFSGRAPINLKLTAAAGRNWEGVARLEQRGLLLVTDKFPQTLLAFIPFE
ncbi:hypothetical protein [Halioxenophilus sp. WMMB6]|uniref:hypothetical protein n=1 Tax=Halioxenophilus sp. WMMB6 TaxID=3073815 RepID=UPI00295EA684|nr:hypothetical protein [Halioxenophilus sp. WMMB6]